MKVFYLENIRGKMTHSLILDTDFKPFGSTTLK